MSIINKTYFQKGELKLPIDNISDIQYFIDNHEKKILELLLRYSLYNEFITALAGTPAQKWIDLRDGKTYTDSKGYLQEYEGIKQIIADYVFFYIIKDKVNYSSDSGVRIANIENSEITHPRYKQKYAWNDMVDRIYYLNEFIIITNESDSTTYPDYKPITDTKPYYFDKVNVLNI